MAPKVPKDDESTAYDQFWEAEDLNLVEEPVYGRGANKANVLVRNGASFDVSAVAVDIIGKVSNKNGLGTSRPSEILFGVVSRRKHLVGIPVEPDTPGATIITYKDGRAFGSLYPIFRRLDRLVQEGYKERYFVKETPQKAKIGDVVGWGIYMDLENFETEPIRKLSEEELAKRRATAAAKKAAKEAAKNATEEAARRAAEEASRKAAEDSASTAEEPEDPAEPEGE